MRLSPIQLLDSSIERIFVERVHGVVEQNEAPLTTSMDFQVFKQFAAEPEYWLETPEPASLKDRTFRVTLGLKTPQDKPFQNYRFELVASGVLMVLPESFEPNRVQDMALEYGLTLLYGILREHLTLSTGRMANGACLLPTMSFLGEAKP